MTHKDDLITAEMLLNAYAGGYFPMAESKDSHELFWFSPEQRGVIPLNMFHIPRSLRKVARKQPLRITVDEAFPQVIHACANVKRSHESGSWINPEITKRYTELWQLGYAHSVECWLDGELVGGLYGVSLGGVFFGESMFSTASNASKIALIYLVDILQKAGYGLLDTQYVNDHLRQFGVQEIAQKDYLLQLENSLYISPNPSKRFSTISGSIVNASTLPDILG